MNNKFKELNKLRPGDEIFVWDSENNEWILARFVGVLDDLVYVSEEENATDIHGYSSYVIPKTWINVNTLKPPTFKSVLLYTPEAGIAEGSYHADRDEWIQYRWNAKVHPKYWRLLPEIPKERE